MIENLKRLPNGSLIVVRGTLVGHEEAVFLKSSCQYHFRTGEMVWPDAIRLAHPLADGLLYGKLYDHGVAYSPITKALEKHSLTMATLTIVVEGRFERREEYWSRRVASDMIVGNGFGHLGGFAAQLVVTRVWAIEVSR
ncbi:MAG TPA: hypothetical protein DEH78_21365 [Solibacterales bacterium]|nr:hypothetical protein [Bryobacterales bacterium]